MANSGNLTMTVATRSANPVHFSHSIPMNLTSENFLVWRHSILPVLRGHGLVGFIDETLPSPSRFNTATNGDLSPNPEYEVWHKQDQLILAWILSSISPSLLTQVVRCDTAAEVWTTINQLYSSQSMAKVLDLKLQLQITKKGGSTCADFIQKMQSITDRLRSIGIDITDQELVLYILQGLTSDFESFVTALSTRSIPPSMNEFSTLLLAHEARILNNLKSISTTAVHLSVQADGSKIGSGTVAQEP
jgi:gag-polypeptide of LTR copia-type